MPFTPLHMGAGIVVKGVMRNSFSLVVFGGSQIAMDIQPLVVMLTGKGDLHGFSHTIFGATLIAVFCGLLGKPIGELLLSLIRESKYLPIGWRVSFVSAFIGTYSHVLIDSIMHSDVAPLSPFTKESPLYGIVSAETLHVWCIVGAIVGSLVYFLLERRCKKAYQSAPPER